MNSGGPTVPTRLSVDHDLASFDCGMPEMNDWLKRHARRNEASGGSRTYVVSLDRRVLGYYCLATGAIARVDAPRPMQRNMPDPVPVILLGRLAVDQTVQGRGIGSALLSDAVRRVLGAAETVGINALLVHAISDEARRFYLAKGFLESPTGPMTLCLKLDTARKSLTA